jgi:hypothetical protein
VVNKGLSKTRQKLKDTKKRLADRRAKKVKLKKRAKNAKSNKNAKAT